MDWFAPLGLDDTVQLLGPWAGLGIGWALASMPIGSSSKRNVGGWNLFQASGYFEQWARSSVR